MKTPGAFAAEGISEPIPTPIPVPTEPPTVPKEMSIKLTAKNQGYYILTKDGIKVSQHTAEREAIESGAEIKRNNPVSVVEYKHDYIVSIELEIKDG